MDQNLKELFLSYTSNADYMKMAEFKKFIKERKICNIYQAESIFSRFSLNKKLLSFNSFKFALEEIAMKGGTSIENLLKDIFKEKENQEKENIKEKKKEIVLRQENLRKNGDINQGEELKKIVEDMCEIGALMKKEILKEKEKNPEKFISIEEATKGNDIDINFCLGVLAQNLEDIGIITAIEKEASNEELNIKSSEMVLQFIMNGLIDKKKFDLHFDFGAKRNNELLNNEVEREKFLTKLKGALSREYKMPEEQIIFGNPQKGSYKQPVIFLNEIFNKIDASEIQKRLKNSKELEEFKYIEEIKKTLIMEGCKLSQNMLDSQGDRHKNWPTGEYRGGLPYYSPQGWIGFGLKVLGKYDNGNDDWLAYDGNKNEWAVAYHGVRTKMVSKLEEAVGNIAKSGFKVGKAQAYEKSINKNQPGKEIGVGIYCSPSPKVMEDYANFSTSESVVQGKHYIMGFMMRVKPDKIRYPEEQSDYWILNATTDEIRPYRILVKIKE